MCGTTRRLSRVVPADSPDRHSTRRRLQLIEANPKIVRWPSGLAVTVIADHDDSRSPVNDRRAHPLDARQVLQARNHEAAHSVASPAIPEPERELARRAGNGSADDQVLSQCGKERQGADAMAIE